MSWAVRFLRIALAMTLLIFTVACGSGAGPSQSAADPFSEIPFPVRETSWTAQKVVDGYPPHEMSEGTSRIFDSLVAQAPPGQIEWAIYRLNAGDPAPDMQSLSITFEESGLGGATLSPWFGLADFTEGKWVFQGPFAEGPTLTLSPENVSPLGNVYLAAVAWDEGGVGIREISLGFDIANDLPYAEITTDTPETLKQFAISLDASPSAAAPGRTLANYEWDLDGDGVFSEAGDEADAEGSATTAVFGNNIPGERLVQVRVTDDQADQATASLTVRFLGSLIVPVHAGFEESVGQYTSLAVIDGKPAVSYYDLGNGNLKYAFSSTVDGDEAADWTHITVDGSAGDVGQYTSLALIDGKPAIAYYDVTGSDLRYAYSSTVGGTAPGDWSSIAVHETVDDVGRFASLELVSGKPAIAYRDDTAQELKYAFSSANDGSSGWTSITADGSDRAGVYASLAVVNGKPAIGYGIQGTVDFFPALKYAWSSEEDGSAGWSSVIIEDGVFTGSFNSLAEVDGRPAIAYSNTSGFAALHYAISSTPEGSLQEDWDIITIDTEAIPFHNSLAVINGKPAIAYSMNQLEAVRYAYSSTVDGSGTTDWTFFTVDDTFNFLGNYTSLAEVNGEPAISYFAYELDDLNYARPNPDLQPSF